MIIIAWAALAIWPIVTIILYRKYDLPAALCATILGGYLLLPTREGLDFPVLPRFDKHSIPVIAALVMTMTILSSRVRHHPVLPGWLPRSPVPLFFLGMLVIGSFGTALTNTDVLNYGPRYLRNLKVYDAFSLLLETIILLLPMLLARRVLATPEAQRTLLVGIASSALAYSILALWEIRMSPQLNVHIYGFFPHNFLQHVRAGGFRPLVFLEHGLTLGIFFTFSVIAAIGLFREEKTVKNRKWAAAAIWLLFVIFLAKVFGALIIALLLAPVALFFKPRTQLLVATCIAGVIVTYPMLRAAHLVPIDQVVAFVADISAERAESLNVRLRNEDMLMTKAEERSLFGWGGWSRNRIFNEEGIDISLTDGAWILQFGVGGWFRYIPIFGLLCWPIVGLFISKREKIDPICATLALILSAKLIDLIPNSGMVPIVWLIAGSLLGRIEMKEAHALGGKAQAEAEPESVTGYARTRKVAHGGKEGAKLTYTRNFSKHDKTARPASGASGKPAQGRISDSAAPARSTLRNPR